MSSNLRPEKEFKPGCPRFLQEPGASSMLQDEMCLRDLFEDVVEVLGKLILTLDKDVAVGIQHLKILLRESELLSDKVKFLVRYFGPMAQALLGVLKPTIFTREHTLKWVNPRAKPAPRL